jgi:putative DNA primase/helicase
MTCLSLRGIAHGLGGGVSGGQALVPGPGHSPRDRSLSIRLSPSAPGGFVVHSHSGDDFRTCRDFVRQRLGLSTANSRWLDPPRRAATDRAAIADAAAKAAGTRQALGLWHEGVDPRGPLVERYLNGRRLTLDNDLAGDVLRWHPRIGAMLALFRNVLTDEPQAISRTFLDREGKKLGRKFLGPALGAAVMLDPFDFVTIGLHVGEGVETCVAARQFNLRPVWALGSAAAVAAFPILGGVECLTLLQENDDASACACEACAARWHAAGREVIINWSLRGKDLNDAIRLEGPS